MYLFIHSSTILLLLFCVSVARCLDVEKISKKLDYLKDVEYSRIPRDSEDDSSIWLEYEFNTGVGNREELVVTNISVHENTNLSQTRTKWQFLEVNGIGYLIRTENSILSFYKFDFDNLPSPVNLVIETDLKIEGTILSSKAINLNKLSSTFSSENVIVILCVESDSGTFLQWFHLLDGKSFEFFWFWPVQKHIKDIEFIQHGDQFKLLLLDENEIRFGKQHSSIDVYGFSIDFSANDFHFWLCQRASIPKAFDIQVCPIYEGIFIALQGNNEVYLYEYRNTMEGSIFQELQTIKSQDLKNFVCFESGYLQFLAISGPEAGLFHFFERGFQYNTESESDFDVSEISWVKEVRLNTYRDESLLLMQLRNSTVIALAWHGLNFKRIQLPSDILDQFDISKVTVIPKFGFAWGNKLVRFDTELKSLNHPLQHNMERLLSLQHLLNDLLAYQEKILNETGARLEKSYLMKSQITGFWNISTVNATNAVITDDVKYRSVTLGPISLTREELEFDVDAYAKILKDLEGKLDEIDTNLVGALDFSSIESNFDSSIEVFGNINVTGSLRVDNLIVESINDVNFESRSENDVIEGKKIFSSIEAENLTVYSLNHIPVKDIQFGDLIEDYKELDFSRITRAEVKEHLFFDTINGIKWKELMDSIVWKDEMKSIPGNTIVEGTLTANTINLNFLNNLRYPELYVLTDSDITANVTGLKSFDELTTLNLNDVKFINDINIEDFVILYKDNVLNETIAFDKLTIEGALQIDDNVAGLERNEMKLLNETFDSSSNIIFLNLTVLGNVTFDSAFIDKRRLNFDDLLLKTEKNVEITGTKRFLGNVKIKSNVTITSGMINGHFMDEFVTLDSDQELPNLIEISSNVTLGNVTFGGIKKLEAFLKKEGNSSNCLEKIIVFKSPITVEELSVNSVNNIPYEDFARKLNETLQNINIPSLKTEKLQAEEIVPKMINGIDFVNFTKYFANLNIIDEYAIEKLETDRLDAKFINGIAMDEINRLKDQLNSLLFRISEGKQPLESLQVTGTINTKMINGKQLKDFYNGTVFFKENISIKNLTILGSMNNFSFLERVSDTVLKTDRNIKIQGRKSFDAISCTILDAASLNGHLMQNNFDPLKEQILTGPVIVNGSVTILNELIASGNIGDVRFQDLMNRRKSLGNNTYEIRGNARFSKNVRIENLFANGTIQNTDFGSFLKATIPKNEDNVTVSGVKVFQGPVTFEGAFVVRDRLNDIDLKRFQKAVFVDKPFSVKSKLAFKDGVQIEKSIVVETELRAKSLMGIDLDELRLSVLYLDRPTYVKETITLNNVTFKSNIEVSKFNDLDMRLLISLNTEQTIPVEILKCGTVNVDEIKILGTVNGEHLKTMQENTFMLIGDQNITGHINFLGNVHTRRDFNARRINDIDPTEIVPLNMKSTLIGNFLFEKPIVLNQGLRVLGYLNGMNPSWWEAEAVTTSSNFQQIISGNWTVLGNVYFENGASGSDILDGANIAELSDTLAKKHLEMDAIITEADANLTSICEDLNSLKHYAQKQIYKFSAFDYQQSIEFDNRIVSLHYFELNDLSYLLINFNSCHMHTYLFTGTKFELVVNVLDFGVVDQWMSFRKLDVLYFLTLGSDSCGKGPTNLWKFEDDKFTHVLSLGPKIHSSRMNQDALLMLINSNEGMRSMGQLYEDMEKSLLSLAEEDDVRIVLKGDQMLLTSRREGYVRNLDHLNNASIWEHGGRRDVLHFKAGVLEKDMFLYYDEEVSKEHIFICSNVTKQKKILQTIKTHKPASFTILNFEGSIETLLVFIENGRSLRIYEYKGIQGFLERDTIRIHVDKLYSCKIRKYLKFAKRQCLALVHENQLTILEAKMYGEKLDMETLTCSKR